MSDKPYVPELVAAKFEQQFAIDTNGPRTYEVSMGNYKPGEHEPQLVATFKPAAGSIKVKLASDIPEMGILGTADLRLTLAGWERIRSAIDGMILREMCERQAGGGR